MNPYLNQYRQQNQGWTRIDMLLALYDGAVDRLTSALGALRAQDRPRALPLLSRVQLIVTELAAGVRVDVDEQMAHNMLRLYEYIGYQLSQASETGIVESLKILNTLREGFGSIREEALEMERSGRLPRADQLQMVQATA